MATLVEQLVGFAGAHPHAVGVLAFLAALAESLAVVGLFVPGSLVLLALGALVPTGAIGFWPLMGWACAGAVVGDLLSYGLGRRYQDDIRSLRLLRNRAQLLELGQSFFERHGVKGVVFGRFLPGTRAIVPLVAGMAGMPPRRFLLASAVAVAVWAPATVLPGVLFGATLSLAAAVSMRLAALLVVLLAAMVALVLLLRLLLRRGLPLALRLSQRLLLLAARRDGRLRPLVLVLRRGFRGEGWVVAVLGATAALSLWGFAVVLEDVIGGAPLARMDSAVYNLFLLLRTGLVDHVMVVATSLGDGVVVTSVFVVVLAVLLARGTWWAAGHWAAATAGGVLFAAGTKLLLHLPRPVEIEVAVAAYASGFPSGHATSNVVLYGMLALHLLPELGALARILVSGAFALLVSAIVVSRLYLGAHWLSDVLGGLTFALAWVSIVGASYFRGPHRARLHAPLLLAIVGLTVALVGGVHAWREHPAALERYAVRIEPQELDLADWWREEWRALPAGRIDMVGDIEEPLGLQWAGLPMVLAESLAGAGFTEAPAWSTTSALAYLRPEADAASLPVLPKLHDGRMPATTLIRAAGRERLVLRLWWAGALLQTADAEAQPLWLASLTQERLRAVPWLATWTDGEPAPVEELLALADHLPASRIAERPDHEPVVLARTPSLAPGLAALGKASLQPGRITPFLRRMLP